MMAAQSLLHACNGCGRANPAGVSCPNCGTSPIGSGVVFSSAQTVPLPPQMRDVTAELIAADALRESQQNASVPDTADMAAQILVCESCGTEARAGFTFCLGCGEKGAFVHRSKQETVKTTESERVAEVLLSHLGTRLHTAWKGEKRQSGINALLSFFMPGVGQIFAGQTAKGLLLLFLTAFMVYTWHWPPFGVALLVLRGLLSLDAYRVSEKRRRGRRVRDWEWNFKV